MTTGENRISFLLQRYTDGSATPPEIAEMLTLLRQEGGDAALESFMLELAGQPAADHFAAHADWNMIWRNIRQEIRTQAPVRRINRRWWAVAALLILALGAGMFWILNPAPKKEIVSAKPAAAPDIAPPAGSKAVLTLANGQQVVLDTAGKGLLALQDNIHVVKQAGGGIAYQGRAAGTVGFNTLTVPRGSQPVALVLADGSHVWLNVASSIRYPVAFSGSTRSVAITGEAYFEVAKNPAMPFIVSAGSTDVEVLGTHFNVKAYDDEDLMKVSLLEGRVKLAQKTTHQEKLLASGQQAQVSAGKGITLYNDVDMDEVMAWKNGIFRFGDKADIETVMREISRWYDIDVAYKGTVKGHIGGGIARNVNISAVLRMLEATGSVKFDVEGRKVTVMP